LGQEFAKEVENTIERIKQNPEAWTVVSSSKQARRCLTNRFPYGIIYQIRQDLLLIAAVWHNSRRPHTWQERLSKTKQ
jgi:toxin ParE1/3/4